MKKETQLWIKTIALFHGLGNRGSGTPNITASSARLVGEEASFQTQVCLALKCIILKPQQLSQA